MNRPTFLRRSTALLLTLVLMVCAALPGSAAYQMPIQTASDTESVYLFNLDTGKPILRQNSDQQRYIASLTKMMTALLFLESGKDMNAEITIPTSLTQEFKDIQNANGSTMNLRIGETVRRIDLLYGLLVASANDAASVIASDVSATKINAGAVANPGIAQKIGEKKIASRNKKPVTTEARPVLAPSATPEELSTNVVVVEVPRTAPALVAIASASSACLILGSLSFSSNICALFATPIKVPNVSNISTNKKDKIITTKSNTLTVEKSALKHCPNVSPKEVKSVSPQTGYKE